jgi:predicted amidohydrolase
MRIALAQSRLEDNVKTNKAKVISMMEEAAENGAQLICFPELQLSPFFPQHRNRPVEKYALAIDDPIVLEIQETCKRLSLTAILNIYLKEDGKYYDASPIITPEGQILGTSKMVHIVQAENFYEQDYYTPSEEGFKVYKTPLGNVGVVICFDRHYPEAIRSCVLKDADIIIIPTANTKAEPSDMFEWELRVPAMQNSVYIAMCNRVGLEDSMDFCGESIVVHADGHVIVKADDKEQIIYADIDIAEGRKLRSKNLFLPLRRPETFEIYEK